MSIHRRASYWQAHGKPEGEMGIFIKVVCSLTFRQWGISLVHNESRAPELKS